MKESYMIVDLQYGSTGKGLLAGYLAKTKKPDTIVTAWGPNAGHTYIDENGRTFIHRMVANGIVSPNFKTLLIGPGSVIDLDVLASEIWECADILSGEKIIIHPHAVVVNQGNRDLEKRNVKIGSTMKGTGAAVIQRIERDPENQNIAGNSVPHQWLHHVWSTGVDLTVSSEAYHKAIVDAEVIQIEGAQGFSLSMYHGFYPYTTSRDVTPAQILADCAIPYSIIPEVYGTLRTYPIRVANRFNESGEQVGTSGPCYGDQREMQWSELGMEPELTTVTKLPRRIFTFSIDQLVEACHYCAPTKLFLNFVNYLTEEEAMALLFRISTNVDVEVEWIGGGATHNDVYSADEYDIDVLGKICKN